jgi:hypothetical protein
MPLMSSLPLIGAIAQVVLFVFAGWFGQWKYTVSLVRSVHDWLRTGEISAIPVYTYSVYGLTWSVKFYRYIGSHASKKDQLTNLLGAILIPVILWVFFEWLKTKS